MSQVHLLKHAYGSDTITWCGIGAYKQSRLVQITTQEDEVTCKLCEGLKAKFKVLSSKFKVQRKSEIRNL